jgi:signal peptidase I
MQVHSRETWRVRQSLGERVRRTLAWSLFVDVSFALVVQPYRPVLVVGESMLPTLGNLQVVIAKARDHQAKRGEVVVCDYDDGSIIKRVAGIGNDCDLPGLPRPLRVPPHSVYLLGDNSAVSVDSRLFGPVPEKDVKMVVVFPPTGRS